MDHDSTGLSDDELRTFEALTAEFGVVRVPRVAAAVGVVRGRQSRGLFGVAVVAFVSVVPLLAVSVWPAFVAFVVAVVAVYAGWPVWVAAVLSSSVLRSATEFLSQPAVRPHHRRRSRRDDRDVDGSDDYRSDGF